MTIPVLTRFRSRFEQQNPTARTDTLTDEAQVAPREMTDAERKTSADLIIKMGRIRRNEIPDDPPPAGSHSEAVLKLLQASRRARGVEE
jgi:hypothetical protein